MDIDIFGTYTMVTVVPSLNIPGSHFLDRYYSVIDEQTTEKIMFDVDEEKPTLTPFCSPLKAGRIVESEGHSTKSFKPAYIKDKRRLLPSTNLKRTAGEPVGGNLSPLERKAVNLRNMMESMLTRKKRRLEIMSAEATIYGRVTVSGDDYPTTVVDFGRDANLTKTLAGAARWGQTDVSPVDDLETWAEEAQDISGAVVTDITLEPKALKLLRADPKYKDSINKDFGSTSTSTLEPVVRGQGPRKARRIGTLGDFTIWSYQDKYTDPEDGTTKQVMPDYGVVLVDPDALLGEQVYGAILDDDVLEAMAEHFKSWVEKDPGIRLVLMQSAPLTVPYRTNASMLVVVN